MRGRGYTLYARRAGDVAGTRKGSTGRWQLILNRKHYLAHRVVWELHNGVIPCNMMIDHINGDYQDNRLCNLRLVDRKGNSRNTKRNSKNSTGVTGVYLTTNIDKKGEPYYYYTTSWSDLDGKKKCKHFPVKKLGKEEAFRQACEYRAKIISELNSMGAGYTERHGKEK